MSDKRLMHIYSLQIDNRPFAESMARNIRVDDDIFVARRASKTTGQYYYLVVRGQRMDEVINGKEENYFSQEELTLIRKDGK